MCFFALLKKMIADWKKNSNGRLIVAYNFQINRTFNCIVYVQILLRKKSIFVVLLVLSNSFQIFLKMTL